MKEWILSLVGMGFLGVLIEVIVPNGKLNTFIKSIFALLLLYVIVSPLPELFNKGVNINLDYELLSDSDYVVTLNEAKLENYELSIKDQLSNLGISNVDIQFYADTSKTELIIQKVYVNTINIVLNEKDKHINISDIILEIISDTLNIDKGEVVIYGS